MSHTMFLDTWFKIQRTFQEREAQRKKDGELKQWGIKGEKLFMVSELVRSCFQQKGLVGPSHPQLTGLAGVCHLWCWGTKYGVDKVSKSQGDNWACHTIGQLLPTLQKGIKMRKRTRQIFLQRFCLCGGLFYLFSSPSFSLFSFAAGCCFQRLRVWLSASSGKCCIPVSSHFAEDQTVSSQVRHLRPLAPRADILKLLKGACNLSSFLHLLYRKEKNRHLVLFQLLWTLPPSLRKRSNNFSFTLGTV